MFLHLHYVQETSTVQNITKDLKSTFPCIIIQGEKHLEDFALICISSSTYTLLFFPFLVWMIVVTFEICDGEYLCVCMYFTDAYLVNTISHERKLR